MKNYIKGLFGKKKSVVNESISPEETARKFSDICEDTQRLIQEALDRIEEQTEFLQKQLEICLEQEDIIKRIDKLEENRKVIELGVS